MRWWAYLACLLAVSLVIISLSEEATAERDFRVVDAESESSEDVEEVRRSPHGHHHGRRRRSSVSRRRSSRRRSSRRRSSFSRRRRSGPAPGGSCHPGMKGRTKCGEYCLCRSDKKWHCCRVRFEVSNLIHRKGGPEVLARYMKTYAIMTKHKMTQADFKAIVEAHRSLFLAGIHELPDFASWHRWYLLQIENMMRKHDCRITIPYVDWGKISHSWRDSKLYTPAIMGTNGDPNQYDCVTDGPFKMPWTTTTQADLSACKASVPESHRCCLQRKFKTGATDNFHTVVYTEGNLKAPPTHYGEFLCILGMDIHVLGHDLPGGTMGTDDSAQAPIFNLHHGYVDYQWWRYLRASAANRAAAKKFHDLRAPNPMQGTDSKVWANITGTKPGGIKASQYLDSTKMGDNWDTCVTYEWDHETLKKKLSPDQVRKLSQSQQWAYLEDKITHESIKTLLKTAHEVEPPWQTLKTGWELFNTPEKCWERVKFVQANVLKDLDVIGAKAVAKDKEDQKTGVEIEKVIG